MIQKIVLCFLCLFGVVEAGHKEKIPVDAETKLVGYTEINKGGTILIDEIGNEDRVYFYSIQIRDFPSHAYIKMQVQDGDDKNLYSLKADRGGNLDAVYYPKIKRKTRKEMEFTFYWGGDNFTFLVSVFPKGWDFNPPGSEASDCEACGRK